MTTSGNTFSASKIALITPGASELNPTPRALYIGVSGTLSFTNQDGTTALTVPVVAGSVIPLQACKITAATSATVYGLYD